MHSIHHIFIRRTQTRSDSCELNQAAGTKLIWEDKEQQAKLGLDTPPRFYEGNFDKFLSGK